MESNILDINRNWLYRIILVIGGMVLSHQAFAEAEQDCTSTSHHVTGEHRVSAWKGGTFTGTACRTWDGDISYLWVNVNQTAGGFDAGVSKNVIGGHIASTIGINQQMSYISDTDFSGSGTWWFGPKVGFLDSQYYTTLDGNYECYVVDDANVPPGEMPARFQLGNPVGESTHNGSLYKHYAIDFGLIHQVWSVRQVYRTSGTSSVGRIKQKWIDLGLVPANHYMYGWKLNVETAGELSGHCGMHTLDLPWNLESYSTDDSVSWSETPSSIPTTGSFSVDVNYSTGSEDRDVTLEAFTTNPKPGQNAWLGKTVVTKPANTSGVVTLTFNLQESILPGTVWLKAGIRPVGSTYLDEIENTWRATTAEVLLNGGFEFDFFDWNAGPDWSVSSDRVEGASSARISGKWYQWLSQSIADSYGGSPYNIADFRGKTITLTFDAKNVGGGALHVGVQYVDDLYVTSDSWQEYSITMTLSNNANQLKVFVEPIGGDNFIDNMRLSLDN